MKTKTRIRLYDDQIDLSLREVAGNAFIVERELVRLLTKASGPNLTIEPSWELNSHQEPVLTLTIMEACCFLTKEQISIIGNFGHEGLAHS